MIESFSDAILKMYKTQKVMVLPQESIYMLVF